MKSRDPLKSAAPGVKERKERPSGQTCSPNIREVLRRIRKKFKYRVQLRVIFLSIAVASGHQVQWGTSRTVGLQSSEASPSEAIGAFAKSVILETSASLRKVQIGHRGTKNRIPHSTKSGRDRTTSRYCTRAPELIRPCKGGASIGAGSRSKEAVFRFHRIQDSKVVRTQSVVEVYNSISCATK